MNADVRSARTPVLVALSGVMLAGLAACGGPATTVPPDRVASTVLSQLTSQGVRIDGNAVTCADGVTAEAGRTASCRFTAGGQPVDAVATVSSVDGDTVNFDIVTRAQPVPRAVLEKAVTEQLARTNVPVERTTCAGDLQPQVGQAQTCTATGGGGDILLTTTVTEVRDGLVNFSIADG